MLIGNIMKDLRGYMKPEEVLLVIGCGRTERDRVMMQMLWAYGCRVGELLKQFVEDVYLQEKFVKLWTLKRRKPMQRVIMVDENSLSILVEYCRSHKIRKGPIFNISERRVEQIVYEAGVKAGIPKVGSKPIHPHHFRHSHAVAWIRKYPTMEGLIKLQQRLGHASLASTIHYLRFATEEQGQEVEQVFGVKQEGTFADAHR
jgi:integrase